MVSLLLRNWCPRPNLLTDRPRPFHHEQADQRRVLISASLADEGEADPDFEATINGLYIPRGPGTA